MTNLITFWLRDESGAVTVDWVVLTAAVVGLGIAAIAATDDGVIALTAKIDEAATIIASD